MFTGLIQQIGTVSRVTQGAVTDVWVESAYSEFSHGESIACDGVCLTVVESKGTSFRVQVAPETLRRSTADVWAVKTTLNLEKAMRMGDRLGGHWVQGHVDGVGTVMSTRRDAGSLVMQVRCGSTLAPFFVEKGSVCLSGVSLTVTAVDAESFSVMLIPETLKATTLGARVVGDRLNIETDIVGKYIARMLGQRGGLTKEQLALAGFL